MDRPFVRSVEDFPCKKRLARLIYKLWADGFTSTAAYLELSHGGDNVCEELSTLNHDYYARDIGFKTRPRRHAVGKIT